MPETPASFFARFTSSSSGPFFAYPDIYDDFDDWDAEKVEATGSLGRWSLSLPTDKGSLWYVFEGATAPSSWDNWVAVITTELEPALSQDLETIKQLLTGGRVEQVSPVTATGQIAGPIVAGDDYLASSNRAFVFYFAPQAFDIATAEFWFGGRTQRGTGWLVQGIIEADTLDGDAVWKGTAELTQEETASLQPRIHNWSAQVRNGTSEVITQRIGVVRVVRGFTPIVSP